MARTKKAGTSASAQRVVKKGESVITAKQGEELREISRQIQDLRELANEVGVDTPDDLKQIGYEIGRIYSKLDIVEDKLDDLLDDILSDEIEIEW